MPILLSALLLINLITFFIYGIDKIKAMHKRWRVPEKYLFFWAFIGGSIGALLGMVVWRHKTKHLKFCLGIPLILLFQLALTYYINYK